MRPNVEILYAHLMARVASNVNRFREVQGLSLDDAAEIADMTSPEWEAIERGEFNLNVSTLAQVADALDVDGSELLNAAPGMAQAAAASPADAESGRIGKERA